MVVRCLWWGSREGGSFKWPAIGAFIHSTIVDVSVHVMMVGHKVVAKLNMVRVAPHSWLDLDLFTILDMVGNGAVIVHIVAGRDYAMMVGTVEARWYG